MEKEKIEYKGIFQRLWSDSVLSQIISVAILSLLTFLYSLAKSVFKEISIVQALKDTLNFKFELYKILIFIAFAVLSYIGIYKWRQSKKRRIGKFDIEQRVGNFTFRELYNALLTHKLDTPVNLLSNGIERQIDLLTLFILYQRQLNLGAEWDHDHFTHYVLGPTLMTYGLTEKSPTTNKLDSVGSDIIQTSKTGFEFYALLERWRVYNDEIMKDDITKTEVSNTINEKKAAANHV